MVDFGTTSEQDVFTEELRILRAAKTDVESGKQPDPRQFEQLVQHYEKLLKTTMKLSRISDIQGRTLKEQEQDLRTASADLQNLEQLRRQLISDISHELRTPITSVQGYIKAFLDNVIQPDPVYLTMIYQKLLTINQLISDLFQLSTLKANQLPLHFKRTSILQWLMSIPRKYELEANRQGVALILDSSVSVEESLDIEPESAILFIDTVRMEQVVTNLLDNALKFTPRGGTVRIYGRLSARPPDSVTPFESAKADTPPYWFTLTVEDTGKGIDPNDLPFIFERFFRARNADSQAVSGAGLGLAISREIVSQHNGRIGADSEAGSGSRFHFSVPAYDGSISADGTLAVPAGS
ncbi:MAG: histidine kinase [Paenibacillus sp.]|nr:histidine kinase [Paenibacillus sp.]